MSLEENTKKVLTTSEDDQLLAEARKKIIDECLSLLRKTYEIYNTLFESEKQIVEKEMDKIAEE